MDDTDDEDLSALASAVLDGGSPLGSGTESAENAHRQELIRQFRLLSEIVAVHRRPEAISAEIEEAGPRHDTLRSWGPLRLLERIGHGTFSDVFRAWDGGLDREVALKLLRDDAADQANRDTGIVEEGRLLAQVRHPNVLTVYGAARYDGRLGIWTEFIRGETLEARLGARGPLPEHEVISIGLDVCRALAAVHDVGTLHRDVKAANVMRQETGRIVLMDFGTGRAVADTRVDLSGTPLYLAPEILSGAPPTVTSDTYAVAVLLFHLLTGSYPVSGRALEDVRRAHALAESLKLDSLRSGCSEGLTRVIARGLNRDPAARYQSARDFERALESARPRPVRALAWAAASFVLLLLAVGIWALRTRSAATDLAQRELLCTDCGDETSISDDGRFLLRPADSGDVEVLDLDRSSTQRLFVKPGSWDVSGGLALQPIWSPDRALVAYRWTEVQNYQHLPPELRVAATGNHPAPRVLLDHLLNVLVHDWSRDGRRVLASVQRPNESSLRLAWIEIANGQETTLGVRAQRRARVSPDGRFIAYAAIEPSPTTGASRASMRLHVMAQDGSRDTVIGSAAVTNTGPVWTPDGSEIVYTSSVSGTLDLWSARVADGHPVDTPQLIQRNIGRNVALGLLRPNRYVYDQLVAGLDRVVIIPVGGSFPQTDMDRAHDLFTGYRPRWSPDGTTLAFFRTRPSGESSDLVIRSVATGTERVVMVELSASRPALFWCHDGGTSLLEQVPQGSGHPRLYRLDVRTGAATRLGKDFPAGFARTNEAALSVDDKTLYTGASEDKEGAFDRIVGIDLATGAVRQVVVLPNAHLGPGGLGLAASPDGRWLAIGIGRSRLAVVGVDGRGFRDIPGKFASDSPFGQVAWTADSRAVLIGQVTPGPLAGSSFRIWRVPLSGGAPEPVTPAFNGPGVAATFDISPDGSRLAIYPNPSTTQTFDTMAGSHDYVRQLVIGPTRPDR